MSSAETTPFFHNVAQRIAMGTLRISGVSVLALLAASSLLPIMPAMLGMAPPIDGTLASQLTALLGGLGGNALASWLDTWGRGQVSQLLEDGADEDKQREVALRMQSSLHHLTDLAKGLQQQLDTGGPVATALQEYVVQSQLILAALTSLRQEDDKQQRMLQLLLEDVQRHTLRDEQLANLVIDTVQSQHQQIVLQMEHVKTTLNDMHGLMTGHNRVSLMLAEFDYRRELSARLNKMELFGVPRMDTITRQQRLNMAYVDLEVMHTSGSQMVSARNAPNNKEQLEILMNGAHIAIDTILSESKRLVIAGIAGSGKTTLLRWTAVCLATRTTSKVMQSLEECEPFYIRLRDIIDRDFPEPADFPGLIALNTARSLPPNWATGKLSAGDAIVLIDGVDEVPITQRLKVMEAIDILIETFPKARYIITSRPSVLKEWTEWNNWVQSAKFLQVTLTPMGQAQIEIFIKHWHEALAESLDEEGREEIQGLSENLIHLLQERPMLQQLTTTPLLCAMICALHRERGQHLPADRLELYEECVAMLIIQRDAARRITHDTRYHDLVQICKRDVGLSQ